MKKLKRTSFILFILSVSAFAGIDKFVHEKDDRVQIQNLNNFRYQIVGLLFDLKTKATCTGTLIGPYHVLTSAHCVYNFDKKKWTESLEFYPGLIDQPTKQDVKSNFKKVFMLKDYFEKKSPESDFAVIELEQPLGQKIGWAGFKSVTGPGALDQTPSSVEIEMNGYPGDMPTGTLWSVSCEATIEKGFWSYYCDTFYGMSGSAIFAKNSQENIIIGIHSYGSPLKNGGLLIDSQTYNLILQWKNFKKYSQNTLIYLRPKL